MQQPDKRYVPYSSGLVCSVDGCEAKAEYEVYLYDRYDFPDGPHEFFEQDFTCPYICDGHRRANEEQAVGEREPRGVTRYPYTNRQWAQGYTRYAPVSEAFPLIIDLSTSVAQPGLLLAYQSVNDELIARLAETPTLMHGLDPRAFEELVADIFSKRGFEVLLTPKTRDGGRDIEAVHSGEFGTSLYYIECKRYAVHRKVGVEVVRQLNGVVDMKRASKGIIATTSFFSKDAYEEASMLEYRMSLRDFDNVHAWLKQIKTRGGDL